MLVGLSSYSTFQGGAGLIANESGIMYFGSTYSIVAQEVFIKSRRFSPIREERTEWQMVIIHAALLSSSVTPALVSLSLVADGTQHDNLGVLSISGVNIETFKLGVPPQARHAKTLEIVLYPTNGIPIVVTGAVAQTRTVLER